MVAEEMEENMKVYYITEQRKDDYPEEVYRVVKVEKCCEEMGRAWGEIIKFGSFESYEYDNKTVNIGAYEHFPEGGYWDDYPINFCPFCGEKIEVIEKEKVVLVRKVKEKRVVREYEWVKEMK